MTAWTDNELSRIGDAEEIQIAPVRRDGMLRAPRPIWIVKAGNDLYVRAAYGPGSAWHRIVQTSGRARISAGTLQKDVNVQDADDAVLDQVDSAYREKYGHRYPSIVDTITDPEHRATTLRLLPRDTA